MKILIEIDKTQPQEIQNYLFKYYNSYKKKYNSDSGVDLIIPKSYTIKNGETISLDLGIKCQPDEKKGYYLYPRSSITKTPLRLANSIGIIDCNYRGNIIAKVDNIKNYDYEIKIDDKSDNYIKFFQLCSPDLYPLEMEIVNNINETDRGSNGFGSTNC